MRAVFMLAAVTTMAIGFAAPAGAASDAMPVWIAICRGEKDANYRQTVDGAGVFNQGLGDGRYETLPVGQTFYKPNHVVCGAAKGAAGIAQVCADNDRQIIFLKIGDAKNPKAPMREAFFCRAAVKIH